MERPAAAAFVEVDVGGVGVVVFDEDAVGVGGVDAAPVTPPEALRERPRTVQHENPGEGATVVLELAAVPVIEEGVTPAVCHRHIVAQ
jgi:hypothetical protein